MIKLNPISNAKRSKRLRKKLRVDDFAERGVEYRARSNKEYSLQDEAAFDVLDEFLDEFLEELESNNMFTCCTSQIIDSKLVIDGVLHQQISATSNAVLNPTDETLVFLTNLFTKLDMEVLSTKVIDLWYE